jgi:hypothetical protein
MCLTCVFLFNPDPSDFTVPCHLCRVPIRNVALDAENMIEIKAFYFEKSWNVPLLMSVTTIGQIKYLLCLVSRSHFLSQVRLIYNGVNLDNYEDRTLCEQCIPNGSKLCVVLKLRGD